MNAQAVARPDSTARAVTALPALPLTVAAAPAGLVELLDQEAVPWRAHDVERDAGRFVLFDSARAPAPPLSARQEAIDLHQVLTPTLRRRLEALRHERSYRAAWRTGPLTVVEEVGECNRRLVRAEVIERLRIAVQSRGGVWLNVAMAPAGYRTFFSLRLDHDAFVPGDFAATLDALGGYEHATGHFLAGAAHQGRQHELRRLHGLDVGSHGYWHHTYPNAVDNLNNVSRGISALAELGFSPTGFTAPGGRFNRGLLASLAELGVTHSSEFGLAHDDWPFFPSGGDVLQIPVHPICLGIGLEAARRQRVRAETAADAIAAHLRDAAIAKHAAGEPLLFYGHPDGRLGRYPHVVRRLLTTVSQLEGVWFASFSQIDRWWRARSKVRLRAWFDQGQLWLQTAPPAPTWPMAVEIWQGDRLARHVLNTDCQSIDVDLLAYEVRGPLPTWSPTKAPAPSLKARCLRAIDWERETPLADIRASGWQGQVKRLLRRIKPAWHEIAR